MKKIIFFIPSLGGGGGERILSHLSLYLPKEVERIIVAFDGQPHYPYGGKIMLLNISVSSNIFFKVAAFVKGLIKLRRIIAQEKPDYVVSFGSITSIINLFASKKAVVRIGNPITKGHEQRLDRLYPLLARLFLNRAKKIIVISKGSKNRLIEHFKVKEDKITVIYNFIDVEKTRELAEEPLHPDHQEIFKHPVIINVANLVEQKGQHHLIKSFKLVKNTVPDAQLVFIGKGHLESVLKKTAQDLGIESSVHFLGWQKNPFKFIARSTVFALPSLWEGFGIVMLEAMACGVPVVAFDCPFGPKEILAPELDITTVLNKVTFASCGVLVPVGQEDHLANAISSVIKDQSLRQNIIHSAAVRVQEFNMEKFLNGYQFLWK